MGVGVLICTEPPAPGHTFRCFIGDFGASFSSDPLFLIGGDARDVQNLPISSHCTSGIPFLSILLTDLPLSWDPKDTKTEAATLGVAEWSAHF